MNDFNDFSNENQTEYMNEETPRSGVWGLGLLVIALLVGGLIWLFLSGSAPALSPDIRILTQYEDDFVFGEYTRYKLLLSNQGQAPSLSRLTVMSTLSQDAIPETVSAPAPWSCTLQPHAVNCQASGVISAGQSLPAIEITTKLPDRKEDGSNGNVRICAAVNTLLDKDLSNNEICEIMTIQQTGDVVAEANTMQEAGEQNEDGNDEAADSNASENSENEVSENDESASEQTEDKVAENSMDEEMPATENDSTIEETTAEDEDMGDGNAEADDVMPSEEEAIAEELSAEEIPAEETSENASTEENSSDEAPSAEMIQTEDKSATQRTAVVVQIGDQDELSVEANGQVLIPVELQPRFNDTIMTVATLQIHFDSALLEPIAPEPMKCGENPDKVWEIAVCNPAFEDGIMRLSVLSTAGVSGANRIAEVEFNVIGSAGTSTSVTGTLISLVDENQEAISYKIQDSLIVIE